MKHKIVSSYIFVMLLIATSCKKVENDLAAQYDQPSVSAASVFTPGGEEIIYPKNVRHGDTITIAGRFNLDKGAEIRLGNEKAEPIHTSMMDYTYYLTGEQYKFEIVKFVVTPGMGSGPQPLIVTYGSYRHQAPDINILTTDISGSRPDTTLVIKQIFDGSLPDFQTRYGAYRANDMFKECLSVTNDGTVFFASLWDIFRVKNGQVEWLLKMEDGIVIDGEQKVIKQLLGAAPNPEGTELYISLEATVSSPDNFNLINYLVKKDLGTGDITVLNKTERETNQWGSATGISRPASMSYNGPIADMYVSASNLNVDKKGRLIFENKGSMTYCGRLDASGNVTPLLQSASFGGTGNFTQYQQILGFTPDGLAAFVSYGAISNPASSGLRVVDLDNLDILYDVEPKMSFNYASFDPNPARRMANQIGYFNASTTIPLKGTYQPISRKEMLYLNGYSIASVNPEQSYIYVYAGIERGCTHLTSAGYLLPVQKELTGPALYVNYGLIAQQGQMRLIGMDGKGTIYFMRGGQRVLSPRQYIAPKIYTLSKP